VKPSDAAISYSSLSNDELIALTEKLREGVLKLHDECSDRVLVSKALDGCMIEFWARYEAAKLVALDPSMPRQDALVAARAFSNLVAARTRVHGT